MTTSDLSSLSLTDAARLIGTRRLSPGELIERVLARLAAVDTEVHAYLRHDAEAARRAAAAADDRARQGSLRGPLDGIPFAVKDTFYTANLPTTAASRVPQRHAPELQATLVTRLQAAGAILLGKLNTWEYGTGTGAVYDDLDVPPARNPWNTAHYTGGSSSGSAASVAAGTALFSLGTDTGGSVRLPAAACGVVGFKPTFGRLSRHGIMPNCWSFDTPGPLTRTVRDAALVYDALAGHDPADPTSLRQAAPATAPQLERSIAGLRIGRISQLSAELVPHPAIQAALEQATELFRRAGAEVVEIAMPIAPAEYRAINLPINRSESFSIHEQDYLEHRHLMGRSLREKLECGFYIRAADYLAALRLRRDVVARTDQLFRQFDLLLLPITLAPAPRLDDAAAVEAFTTRSAGSPFSLSGHPALSLPLGLAANGLPVAVQLAAGYCQEDLLLRAAHSLERGALATGMTSTTFAYPGVPRHDH